MTDANKIRITSLATALAYLAAICHEVKLSACGKFVEVSATCKRCGGTGYIGVYSYIDQGICYNCHGQDTLDAIERVPVIHYARTVKRKVTRDARAAEKRAARAAEHARREAARQARLDEWKARERAASTHLGTVGERDTFELTVCKILEWSGNYGPTYCHILKTDGGSVVIYKSGSHLDAREGMKIRVKATVKSHGERDGVAQTVVQRATVTHTMTGSGWLPGGACDAEQAASDIVHGLFVVATLPWAS